MKLHRRKFLHLATGIAALPMMPRLASAFAYPTRPVRIVVGFPAGTAPDIVARLLGEWLSEKLGQQFVVDDRPGAATNVATKFVAHSSPDGYTLLALISTNAINATLYENLNFDFVRDIVPIGLVGTNPFVMVVTPSIPAKTVPEFIAYTKANPGKIYMASQGTGSTPHVCGELLKMMTGIDFVHVPYRDALMPDLLAGRVHFYFSPTPQAVPYIKDGRLRALGVTSAKRSAALPDVPTIAEYVSGYEALGWFGIGAPRGTPGDIVMRLNTEMRTVAATDPNANARLLSLGIEPHAMTPAEFKTFIAAEVDKWAKVIAFAHIKPS